MNSFVTPRALTHTPHRQPLSYLPPPYPGPLFRALLDGQPGPVGHLPQLPSGWGVSRRAGDQLGHGVPGERVAVHPSGKEVLGTAQRPHGGLTAAPQPGSTRP